MFDLRQDKVDVGIASLGEENRFLGMVGEGLKEEKVLVRARKAVMPCVRPYRNTSDIPSSIAQINAIQQASV